MCDTIVALGNSTKDGSVIFAKNSDRQPNEPHIMVRIPGKDHNAEHEKYLRATYIQIPQVKVTYEVVLLKPSWIWGCEMGWNEHGLNIGNEAVFTKERNGKASLIGMDMARIVLERCKTSADAIDTITELLKLYGQGGNCGYEKPFTYHNSFLIADKTSAWVLETAGGYWAAKQVKDIYCISNCLTIENDYDKCHPDLVKHAADKKWCKSEKDFSFARCYSNNLYTYLSGSKNRRKLCETVLKNERGNITVDTMKSVLRTHDGKTESKQFMKASVKSVCMHAGGLIGDHTTGSYIAHIGKDTETYWVTGASTPCVSVFKPIWMVKDTPLFREEERELAIEYWRLRERLHRMILAGLVDMDLYILERDGLEIEINDVIRGIDFSLTDEIMLSKISKEIFEKEKGFISSFINRNATASNELKGHGNLYFKHYWNKRNSKL